MENKQTAEKLTAMEHLINWIDSDCTPMDCVMKAKELLQMEKEQIIKFAMHLHQVDMSKTGTDILMEEAEQYYNKTYGKI
jgi:hypothetical protein